MNNRDQPVRPGPWAAAAACLCLLAGTVASGPAADASAWQSRLWAMDGKAKLVGGYDSNLFARRGGGGDGYVSFTPIMTLRRLHSLTKFDTSVGVVGTTYIDGTVSDSLNPQFEVDFAHPIIPRQSPTQRASLKWYRRSTANSDLGSRVDVDEGRANWAGRLFDTGKTSVNGRFAASYTDYRRNSLNTNESVLAGVGVGFRPDPLYRLEGDYYAEWGRSKPHPADFSETRSLEHVVSLKLMGHLLPKVSGSAHLGISYVTYSGAFNHSRSQAVGGADLSWMVAVGASLSAKAVRFVDFTPDGNAAIRNRLLFGAKKALRSGFSVRGELGVERTSYSRNSTYRTDDAYTAGGYLDYALTDRLKASVGYQWTQQNSNTDIFNYSRNVITGNAIYVF